MTGPSLPSRPEGPSTNAPNSADHRSEASAGLFTERELPKEMGLRAEIERWRALIREPAHASSVKTLQELDQILRKGVPNNSPPAWVAQPLYASVVVRRIIRAGLQHFNLSHQPALPGAAFVEAPEYGNLLRAQFPTSPELSLYKAAVNGATVYFAGTLQSDGSIGACEALYLSTSDASELRPVRNIHELLVAFGVGETPASTEAVIEAVSGHREYLLGRVGRQERSDSWCRSRNRERSEPLLRFLSRIHDGSAASAATVNWFLEATMHQRHPAFHSYVNQLPPDFRPDALTPVSCAVFSLDPSRCVTLRADQDARALTPGLSEGRLVVHPVAEAQLSQIAPWLSQQPRSRVNFLPSVSGRSGVLHDGTGPLAFQVKLDLPTWMSGWFKILGLDTAQHEVDVARFLGEMRESGRPPPAGLDLLLSTSATVYRSELGVNLATVCRPIPEALQGELLLPAAHLYTAIAEDSSCLLEEVLRGKTSAEAEEFFESVLISPLHQAWDYFLSLEVPARGIWGYAAQLHGVNFYHRLDGKSGAVTPQLVVKDFGSERILVHDGSPRSVLAAQKWLLTEYDHYLGYLYLTPLLEAFARVSGQKLEHLEAIVQSSFKRHMRPENRRKFLIQGEVVALHQDAFMQVHDRNLARKELWTRRPRFRPHAVEDYL